MDRIAVGVQVASGRQEILRRAGGLATGLLAGLVTLAAGAGCAHQGPSVAAAGSQGSLAGQRATPAVDLELPPPSQSSAPLRVDREPPPPRPSSALPQVDLPPPPPSRPVELPPPPRVEAEPPRQHRSMKAPPGQKDARAPIPLYILAGAIEPIRADDPTLPDHVLLVSRGKVLKGSYSVCIGQDGSVQSVTPVVGIAGVDRSVVDTLKTWQFPKLPQQICKLQPMSFDVQ